MLPRSKFSQYASANGILVHMVGLIYAPVIGYVLDLTKRPRIVDGQPVIEKGQQVFDYAYGLTFWGSMILAVTTMLLMTVVYWRFNRYGGTRAYRAPGDLDPITPHEPPKRIVSTILLYLVGAATGGAIGYLASYFIQQHESVPLTEYFSLLKREKPVRDLALLVVATGVMPGATLGAIFATRWNQRKAAAAGQT